MRRAIAQRFTNKFIQNVNQGFCLLLDLAADYLLLADIGFDGGRDLAQGGFGRFNTQLLQR